MNRITSAMTDNGNTTGQDAGDTIGRIEPVGFAGDDGVPIVNPPTVVPGVLVAPLKNEKDFAPEPSEFAEPKKGLSLWLKILLTFVGTLFGKNPMLSPNTLVITAQIRTAIKTGQAIEPAGLKLIDDTLNAIDHVAGSDNYGEAIPQAFADIMLVIADGKEIALEVKALNAPPTA